MMYMDDGKTLIYCIEPSKFPHTCIQTSSLLLFTLSLHSSHFIIDLFKFHIEIMNPLKKAKSSRVVQIGI